jgi:hypothetical protein
MTAHSGYGEPTTRDPKPLRFPRFFVAAFGGHSLGMAVALAILGLILGIPLRRLLVPFLAFAYCGVILAASLYLARVARVRWPDRFPVICGLVMFLYWGLFLLALGFTAIRLQFLSLQGATNKYAGVALLSLMVAFMGGYMFARQLNKSKRSE